MKKIYYDRKQEEFLIGLERGEELHPYPDEVKYCILMNLILVYGDVIYSYALTQEGLDFLSQRLQIPTWVQNHRIGGLKPKSITGADS